MVKVTMRGVVRVICCLHLPADETMEVNTADRQKNNDWINPVSAARVIPQLDAVPESRPATSTVARGIKCGSTAITGRRPLSGATAPAKIPPQFSSDNHEDASTQTDFDGFLGQNSSPTSRHWTSLPKILLVGRAALSGSVTGKRRKAQCSQVREEQSVAGQVDLQESQKDDVGERQDASVRLQRHRENAVGERKEAAHQYIAYRPGN
ncbi:hypothetical protein V493_04008 [Pseudogymnoascus sp. VKM F-4281 (FW-2241)]|nr:hypothetical protein V493_04008 [Pseudogymnoascus sp. VKM F-4281 (FW-2241)]